MSENGPTRETSYLPRSWGKSRGERKRSGEGICQREASDTPEPEELMSRDHEDDDPGEDQDLKAPGIRCEGPGFELGSSGKACPPHSRCLVDRDEDIDPFDDSPGASSQGSTVKVNIAGVRFCRAGKIYHFDAGGLQLQHGDWVIVKTEKGMGLGQVATPPRETEIEEAHRDALRGIIRRAEKSDFDQRVRCGQKEAEARAYCLERIEALGLPMKLVAVECFFDGSKYVFYFTAEGRVDFRELVKQLVARFPVRIEMRQIGVRHEAKMTGGIASCGQELCCCRFLTDFRPVSVKMAKTQNLSLNPTKISGVCGRLMCCLAYEHDIYEGFRRGLPKVGKAIRTRQGEGVVVKYNPLKETVCIRMDEDTLIEVTRAEILRQDEAPGKEKQKENKKGS